MDHCDIKLEMHCDSEEKYVSLVDNNCQTDLNTELTGSSNASNVLAILDGTFFEINPEKCSDKSVVAVCIKCKPKKVEIKGRANSTSNFRSHLKRRHGNAVLNEYSEHMKVRKIKNSKKQGETSGTNYNKTFQWQQLTQENLNRDITNYILHSMAPLRTVEDPYFLKIFENLNISDYGTRIMSRRDLTYHIRELFNENISKVKNSLKELKFVCTTADIWSARGSSFLGVTAHWIEPQTLERKSVALACRRFAGIHSYDKIAERLEEIHVDFDLNFPKLTATVTDNGSNFLKVFKVFGVEIKSEYEDEYDSTDSDGHNVVFNNENEVAEFYINDRVFSTLPRHIHCFAHTLSLCITTDVIRTIKNSEELNGIHNQVIHKCTLLWNALSRPKSAEIIESVLGYTLSRPEDTRWNSLYDALIQITQIKDKTYNLFKILGIKCELTDSEFQYIEEHISCTEPIAQALDILQGEEDVFYGMVIPCLLSLQRKLQHLNEKSWTYCKPLIQALCNSIEIRFENYLNFRTPESEKAVIAAFSHPKFKNKWLSCVETDKHKRLLSLFKRALSSQIETDTPTSATPNNHESNKFNHFFDFGTLSSTHNDQELLSTTNIELLTLQYFTDKTEEYSILNTFPAIKNIFIQYNTPLPSSAPVERLFSFATIINEPKANKLSDTTFEQRVILKANLLKKSM
ncbi:uncharacterized protein LOC143343753 [Colletes latitarsis]|uniref:uncharacterized protein LOC143343753 n=1 Tax=Colletes latitarsis TaxID=2605962 RepID=UPI00403633BE